jgi:hypothetical protein
LRKRKKVFFKKALTNPTLYAIIISTGEGNTPRANAGAQVEIGEAKRFPPITANG